MKVRKLAVALALAGGLGSGVAQALGLGEIELQSYLNEPLDAEINLRKSQGIDPDDVFVNIASENDYQRVGINRNYFLTKLQFEVTTGRDGSLLVNVSSREPLREPYLNFLLEVTWPNGRLMREYAVLVDPPVYAEESGVEERVAAPSTRSEPAPRQQPSRAPSRAADSDVASRSGDRARTFGPTNPSDTLWKIAASTRPDSSVSMQQVMLAIQDLNPDAFMGGNINRLKRGEVLRLPEMDEIRSRSAAEANRQVAAQNEALSTPRRTVDATESAPETAADRGAAGEGGDELRLITAEDSESRSREDGGSAGGDGQSPGGVDAGSAVAMEELESARRENQDLNSRVEDLQDQVETLQRLLELKDSQLAEIQQMEGEGAEEPEASAAEDSLAADGDTAETVSAEEQTAAQQEEQPEAGSEPLPDDETDVVAEEAADDAEQAPGTADEPGMADEQAPVAADGAAPSREAEPAITQPTAPAQQPDKGFPGNIIDAITNNPMYQLALGGGLVVLLLLLLLLARRNANREKAFYEQLNEETDDTGDSFELTLDDDETGESTADEPMAEAETYVAYGQLDKAAETLETAISREPSRSDLRLKLLGVYADTQDRGSFDKQFREIEALDDEQAIAAAILLRDQLEEAESMPSIDDLESQLRSDSFTRDDEAGTEALAEPESHPTDENLADQFETTETDTSAEEPEETESDFSALDLGDTELEEGESGAESGGSDMIEFDLTDFDLDATEEEAVAPSGTGDASEEEFSFDFEESDAETLTDDESVAVEDELDDDLSLEDFDSLDKESDLASSETAVSEDTEEPAFLEESTETSDDPGELDESFLDELDAELDKVAGESGEQLATEGDESSLDDLELDVSDEDLALMEEFADSGDTANPETVEPGPSLDEELNLEDALSDERAETPEELTEEAEDLAGTDGIDEELAALDQEDTATDEDASEPPVASDALDKNARQSAVDDIDESDLGDDDDFDFLAGTDEAATKLDLARAYIEMGDMDGARDILEEVALEGSDEQKTEAQDLLKNLA